MNKKIRTKLTSTSEDFLNKFFYSQHFRKGIEVIDIYNEPLFEDDEKNSVLKANRTSFRKYYGWSKSIRYDSEYKTTFEEMKEQIF